MTYAMLILEAKDAVSVRRLFGRLFAGRVDQFLAGMPSWMLAYVGALVAMLAFVLTFDPLAGTDIADQIKDLPQFPGVGDIQDYQISWRALLLAFLMFVTRDMAIFLMFNFSANAKRADFVAVLWASHTLCDCADRSCERWQFSNPGTFSRLSYVACMVGPAATCCRSRCHLGHRVAPPFQC